MARQESRTYERLYTPPEETKAVDELAGMSDAARFVTGAMMKLKQEQLDEQEHQKQDQLLEVKDTKHL